MKDRYHGWMEDRDRWWDFKKYLLSKWISRYSN